MTQTTELPAHLDPRGPKPGARGSRSWPRRLAIAASCGVLAISGVSWASLELVDGNIKRLEGVLEGSDKAFDEPRNILVVGSDTREGQDSSFGSADVYTEQLSDSMLLVHLAPGVDRATVISLPRDSWVEIPAHTSADGQAVPAEQARLNTAFGRGGAALLVQTVQQVTGLSVDHYVEVDFAGFQNIVDALGGVRVCLNEAVKEPRSQIDLPAGEQTVSGEQALAFVRQRYELPRGDFDRIQRQQAFISAVVREAQSSGTLLNPTKWLPLLDSVTSSITVDADTSIDEITDMALQMRELGGDQVRFVTLPISEPQRIDGKDVLVVDEAGVAALVAALDSDDAAEQGSPGDGPPPLSVAPGEMQVRVLNGAGVQGLARKAADDLAALGFGISGSPGNADQSGLQVSEIRHPADLAEEARTLAASVPGARLVADEDVAAVTLVVGSSYDAAAPPGTPSAGSSGSPSTGSGTTPPSAPAPSIPSARSASEIRCVN